MNKADNPGVQFPPPFLYLGFFAAGVLIQNFLPIDKSMFDNSWAKYKGIFFFLVGIYFCVRSIGQFIRTKNTIIPNKPADSLQTTGVYHITRNPMYLSLACIYLGFASIYGNWWHIILLPFLIWAVQVLVIKREEQYLGRKFGDAYVQYRQKVRRWI